MLRRGWAVLAILAVAPAALEPAPAPRSVPAGYTETLLVSTLTRPVALAFTPDGRLLIAEQYSGQIRVFTGGALLPTPYATVSPVYTGDNESGVLGLCVDPDFATNGYVYVFVTRTNSVQQIVRYTTSGNTGASPTVMVDNIPTNGINHNGGGIGFGPDGYLYAVVGENGSAASDAQVAASWRGKVLRFDASTAPASIPASNPTAGSAVFSIGHRHPFRLTFRPTTNALYVSENGPGADDEINVISPGANYGWPIDTGDNTSAAYTDPVYTFPTTIAITDMLFYTGSTMPFVGDLFYVDYKGDRIRRFTVNAASEQITGGPYDFVTGVNEPIDVEQGPDGALYYCSMNPGRLYMAQANGAPAPPPPSPPYSPGGSGDSSSGNCGLLGFEAVLLAGAVALARRIFRRR
ncbi:MAG TPA: PQQ-dependent sugar dehydrogenase [Planctomycetota bacterium]|nr:PQQ-dependent sugar dehydrogenase [Planctomycetota bacterium]